MAVIKEEVKKSPFEVEEIKAKIKKAAFAKYDNFGVDFRTLHEMLTELDTDELRLIGKIMKWWDKAREEIEKAEEVKEEKERNIHIIDSIRCIGHAILAFTTLIFKYEVEKRLKLETKEERG